MTANTNSEPEVSGAGLAIIITAVAGVLILGGGLIYAGLADGSIGLNAGGPSEGAATAQNDSTNETANGSPSLWDGSDADARPSENDASNEDTSPQMSHDRDRVWIEDAPEQVATTETATYTVAIQTAEPTTGEIEMIVGHTPETVDTAEYETENVDSVNYARTTVTLSFETAHTDDAETFPVRFEATHGMVWTRLTVEPVDDDGNDANGDEWNQSQREEAAAMIEAYYSGYETGISQATDSGWAYERGQIRNETAGEPVEPWPLYVWNSTDEAFDEGMHLGADEGAEPVEQRYLEHRENATEG